MSQMTVDSASGPSPKATASHLTLDGVEKLYRTDRIETVALSEIHLDIREREFISIMGPSGSGKSTLLHIMGLLDEPTAGTVSLEGHRIDTFGDRDLSRIRNERIGFIFQSFHLIPDLNVADNVEIPLLYRGTGGRERRRRVEEALERVGLTARRSHFPTQLSGGQQQRVAIARAIVGTPKLLLADEPTGNLDSQMGEEIMGILETLNREGATVIMVTHDPGLAERTQRTLRLFDGRQVQ